MRGLEIVAERAARRQCEAILARVASAVANQAPDAEVAEAADELRARGRALARRWISEPALRFPRRIGQ